LNNSRFLYSLKKIRYTEFRILQSFSAADLKKAGFGGTFTAKSGGLAMRKCMDGTKLHLRLRKIAGQINAIEKMVDEDVRCEDVLIQINAAKSALHKVGQLILEGHLNHCVREGIEHGDADQTLADFAKALEHFARMS